MSTATKSISLIDTMLESDELLYQRWGAEMAAAQKINFGDLKEYKAFSNEALAAAYAAEPDKFILDDGENILVLFEDRMFVHLFVEGRYLRTRYAVRSKRGVLICPFEQISDYGKEMIGCASPWDSNGPNDFTDTDIMNHTGELFGFTGNILLGLHHARSVAGHDISQWGSRG